MKITELCITTEAHRRQDSGHWVVTQFAFLRCVILSVAVCQAERKACPERSRRDLLLNRPGAPAKLHHHRSLGTGGSRYSAADSHVQRARPAKARILFRSSREFLWARSQISTSAAHSAQTGRARDGRPSLPPT